MLNSSTKLKDFLHPFNDLTSFLSASNIVKTHYSSKLDNVAQVSMLINNLTKSNIAANQIRNFIHQITTFPMTYGFQFVKDISYHEKELHELSAQKNLHTRTIVVNIDICYLCQLNKHKKVRLEIKEPRFSKDAMLYSANTIGNI